MNLKNSIYAKEFYKKGVKKIKLSSIAANLVTNRQCVESKKEFS